MNPWRKAFNLFFSPKFGKGGWGCGVGLDCLTCTRKGLSFKKKMFDFIWLRRQTISVYATNRLILEKLNLINHIFKKERNWNIKERAWVLCLE